MNEEKFWKILDENKKYIGSENYEGHHEHLLRLAFHLKTLGAKESKQFISILYEKFHSLFLVENLKQYALMYISPEFQRDDFDGYTFILPDGNSKVKLYDWCFFSNYRDFRYNLIRNGRDSYLEFKNNPNQIYNLISIANEKLEDSVFRVEPLIDEFRYYNFKKYNYGTFIGGLRSNFEQQRMMEKITFGNYTEDNSEILRYIPDYSQKQSFVDAFSKFSESERNTISKCIQKIEKNDEIRFL